MKKALLLLSLATFSFAANAQDDDYEESSYQRFKPKFGDVTTEVGIVGGILNTDFKLNDASGMLRGRYFTQNDMALRMGLNLTVQNEKDKVYNANNAMGFRSETNTIFLMNVGLEKHFFGTKRLSPYVGADVLFGFGAERANEDNYMAGVYQSGVSATYKRTDWSLGLRGVMGADYYIAQRVYLGAEVGLGFLKTWAGEERTTLNGNTTINPSAGSSFGLAPSVVTGLRLGFVF